MACLDRHRRGHYDFWAGLRRPGVVHRRSAAPRLHVLDDPPVHSPLLSWCHVHVGSSVPDLVLYLETEPIDYLRPCPPSGHQRESCEYHLQPAVPPQRPENCRHRRRYRPLNPSSWFEGGNEEPDRRGGGRSRGG